MQTKLITYILVILTLLLGGIALTFYLQGQAEDEFVVDEDLNQQLKLSLLSVKENDHILGHPDARVAIVEYADSDCEFCTALMPKLNTIITEYKAEDVVWVYRHSQLPVYPQSHKEAEAMECIAHVGDEAMYRIFRDRMYEHTLTNDEAADGTYLSNIAVELGLDRFDFYDCYAGEQFKSYVQDQKNSAATLKVSTVPHTFLVDTATGRIYEVVGNKPAEIYTTVIDQFLSP